MAIITHPTTPGFMVARWALGGHTIEHESPTTGSVQTLGTSGSRWAARFELPPMARATAAAWVAFLTRLNGREGRFFAGDPSAKTPRGVATGTPLVNGASQTGKTLATDGWTPTITGILLAGDFIAYDTPSGWRQLHMVVLDANSDGSGLSTLTITPPIRESPANNATIIIASPTCVMMLATDEEAGWDISTAIHFGLAFSAVEVFEASA